jgi:hypothetical protein
MKKNHVHVHMAKQNLNLIMKIFEKLKLNPTPSKVNKIIDRTIVESKMTPMHAQSIFICIYIKIHGSQK